MLNKLSRTNLSAAGRFIFREDSQHNFRILFKDLTFWYFWVKPKVQLNKKESIKQLKFCYQSSQLNLAIFNKQKLVTNNQLCYLNNEGLRLKTGFSYCFMVCLLFNHFQNSVKFFRRNKTSYPFNLITIFIKN